MEKLNFLIKTLKKLKNWKIEKHLGGLRRVHMTQKMMSSMLIHWHIDSNNLNRPKFQADHPNFGGMEWKSQKLSVVYSTTHNNQGKKTPWADRIEK